MADVLLMGWEARRVRDFAAYLVIALALGFGILWFADHSHGMGNDFIIKWGGLALNTAILYGYFTRWSKRYWHVLGLPVGDGLGSDHSLACVHSHPATRPALGRALVPSDVSH
jgi:hypothetical protein